MTENEIQEELRKMEILKMWLRFLKVYMVSEDGSENKQVAKQQIIELGSEVEVIVHERTPGY